MDDRKLLLAALLLAQVAIPEPLGARVKLDILTVFPDDRIPLPRCLRSLC